MLINKIELQRTLRAVTSFDTSACPYVAVQLTGDTPSFYRVGNFGIIQSKSFTPDAPTIYVSLNHLSDILKVVPEDSLEIYVNARKILCLDSLNPSFQSHFFAHTVSKEQTGMKAHLMGSARQVTLDPAVFTGLDVRPFQTYRVGEPLLENGRLMIPTQAAVIFWDNPLIPKTLQVSPRTSLLRIISGYKLEELFISERGYWSAVSSSGLTACVSGHTSGNSGLFNEYSAAGEELAVFPASQFMYGMDAASTLCGVTNKVEIDPKVGVVFKDHFGEPSSIGIGTYTTFHKFEIHGQSAKTIHDAFSQTTEDEIILTRVTAEPTPIMRFRRGAFEVNVRILK